MLFECFFVERLVITKWPKNPLVNMHENQLFIWMLTKLGSVLKYVELSTLSTKISIPCCLSVPGYHPETDWSWFSFWVPLDTSDQEYLRTCHTSKSWWQCWSLQKRAVIESWCIFLQIITSTLLSIAHLSVKTKSPSTRQGTAPKGLTAKYSGVLVSPEIRI